MCSQYSTIALYLFDEFSLGRDLLSVIGWDDSVIGDHSQLLFSDGTVNLLLDPTVGLIVRDVTLEGIYSRESFDVSQSFLKDDSLAWYSNKIKYALSSGALDVWNLTYSVPGFDEWVGSLNQYRGARIDLDSGGEVIVSTNFGDVVTGGDLGDVLYALSGSDVLNGGRGIDVMYGGAGNDRYYVDDYRERVLEVSPKGSGVDAGGVDKIFSFVSYRLPVHVEHMTLVGGRDTNAL